jgi:hypothetical protein
MNKNEHLQILIKEVKEISELLDGFTECDVIPKVLIKMASEKAQAFAVGIAELENCKPESVGLNYHAYTGNNNAPDVSNENDLMEKAVLRESENIEMFEENVAVPEENQAANDDVKPQLPDQGNTEEQVDNQNVDDFHVPPYPERMVFEPVVTRAAHEAPVSNNAKEESQKIADVTSTPANADIRSSYVANSYSQQNETNQSAFSRFENEKKTPAEAFEKDFHSQPKNNISSVYHPDDIRKLLTLNDRFLFQRELFRGDVGMLNYVLNEINNIGTLDEALDFIGKKFNWNPEAEGVDQFIELIERYYNNKTAN